MSTQLWNQAMPVVQWSVVLAACAVATFYDVSRRKIPNLLTAPLLLTGLLWSTWAAGSAGLADSAAACLLLAAPYVALFVFAGGGAGDAKLMGAIGAWLGVWNGLVVLFCVSLAAIALGMVYALARKRMRETGVNIMTISYRFLLKVLGLKGASSFEPRSPLQTMPYALAISAGTLIAATGIVVWRLQQ